MMLSSKPHLAVEDWLQKLDLSVYAALFKNFSGVEDMLYLSERELKNIGIRNGSHRARLATSLSVLRGKYEKAYNKGSGSAASTSCLKATSPNSKSFGSSSPVPSMHWETSTSGVRSWPSSASPSLAHTRHSSHRASMEGGLGNDATAEDLKRALEQELSLNGSDLRSFAWYHGTILRQRAEELVAKDGDFIVRDCISQPGDFVITCKWEGQPLHFIIKKVILQPNTVYERIQYCFENDSFDSISDFITYYVGSRCPLSSSSGVVISNPINRTMPLSYYASRYGVQCQIQYAAKALEKIPQSPNLVDDNQTVPLLPDKTRHPNDKSQDLVPCVSEPPLIQRRKLIRVGSDPSMNPNAEKKTLENRPNSGTISTEAVKEMASKIENDKPPPKPSRVPSKRCSHRPLVIKRERKNTPPTPLAVFTENSDSPSGSPHLTFFRRGWSIPYKRTISGETRFSFLDHPSVSDDGSDTETLNAAFTIPPLHPLSCFCPTDFQSPLLTNYNKPLENSVLSKVKEMLLNESAKKLAHHLMRVDLEVAKNFEDEDLGLGITSGLELILLPQGQQLVNDLLERSYCLKLFVAITLLTCSSEDERVVILHAWINIAIETKNACGNFYGFTNIMLGLTLPQVLCLNHTWLSLRRSYTETAFTFETKLRPALKAMQEASNKVPPNTCIPYIMSLLSVLQQHLLVVEELQYNRSIINENSLDYCVLSEPSGSDFGLLNLENHLSMGRNVLQQWPVFRSNAEITLKNVKYDSVVLDVFRTEFHLRLLWGSRGAVVSSNERHEKFQKVLNILCSRCEQ